MKVKICGNNTLESALVAEASGADFLGFIFFHKSPRNVTYQQAAEISSKLKGTAAKVAVTVNPTDDEITQIISAINPEYIQLHGTETPDRAIEIKEKFGLKIIKAISISEPSDLENAESYKYIADYIMFDAKPPKDAENPGGNAISFDWSIIKNANIDYKFILAGGLKSSNLEEAVKITGAKFVDVVSGVESSPGVKDIEKIKQFILIAKNIGGTDSWDNPYGYKPAGFLRRATALISDSIAFVIISWVVAVLCELAKIKDINAIIPSFLVTTVIFVLMNGGATLGLKTLDGNFQPLKLKTKFIRYSLHLIPATLPLMFIMSFGIVYSGSQEYAPTLDLLTASMFMVLLYTIANALSAIASKRSLNDIICKTVVVIESK